mgnify:CR=1 FL=1|tara:strand:- start:5508 stop:6191 length:684 start_codon:yes stop_codon:yes gene_type:complete
MLRSTLYFYIIFLLISFYLAAFPQADIQFSRLFYHGDKQFMIKHYLTGESYYYEFLIRRVALPFLVCFILIFPIFLKIVPVLGNFFKNLFFKITDIVFIYLSAILLGVFVNIVLKIGWGRARPNDISEFGGDKIFTPWIQISDQCATNCSFVSGDASAGFFFACLYIINKNKNYFYFSVFAGLLFGFMRIGAGAHFLSDILMSFIIVNLLLKIFHIIYYSFLKWIKV